MYDASDYYTIEKFLSYYALFLIVIGTICNLLSFYIMNRKKMRKITSMRYLSALAISDLILLYQWNLNNFYKYNLSQPPFYLDLEKISLLTCRTISFFGFSTLQISAWILSFFTIDRLISAYPSLWKIKLFLKSKLKCKNKTTILITSIFIIIFFLNSHILLYNGFIIEHTLNLTDEISNTNNTTQYISYNVTTNEVFCYRSLNDENYIFPKWQSVHLIVYSLFPFTIILVSNTLILCNSPSRIKRSGNCLKKYQSRRRKLTLTLVLITFTFMLLTTPSVIMYTFFRHNLQNKPYRRLVNMIVNSLLHTKHAINFFLYVLTAPNFRQELSNTIRNLLFICKSTGNETKKRPIQTDSINYIVRF